MKSEPLSSRSPEMDESVATTSSEAATRSLSFHQAQSVDGQYKEVDEQVNAIHQILAVLRFLKSTLPTCVNLAMMTEPEA